MTMSVINTAQDGNAMGQKVSTWIVLRIVTGMALLVPSYNGYSAIQVLVMWAITQGVGFADTIWSAAIDTMAEYGGVAVLLLNTGLEDLSSSTENNITTVDATSSGSSQYYDELVIAVADNVIYNPASLDPDNPVEATVSDIFYSSICAQAQYEKCLAVNSGDTDNCSNANTGIGKSQEYDYSNILQRHQCGVSG